MSANDELVKVVAESAARAAVEYLEREKRQQDRAKRDWRLRNTKLLLRHYREFVEHSEEIKISLSVESDTLEDLYTDDLAVEAIRRSKQRTLVMVRFIQRTMETYRIRCEKSGEENEVRRYHVIHDLYIGDENLHPDEIAERHFINRRTVYKDVDEAVKTLSVLIFGIDAIRLE